MVVDYEQNKFNIKLIDFNYVFKIEKSEEKGPVLIGTKNLVKYLE